MSEVKKIMVVSNTHWDREFRFSFEKTRHNLLRMMDTTLDILESDPAYHSFTMDGHSIMIEDYLEMRPEKTELVKKLISSGRLIIGPYYTLSEEFSIGHEALVRNLMYGRKLMDKYGAPYNTVAYTPSSWGQTGQYPQILCDFGINKMMFYRGISHDEAPAEYIWEAPDGTQMYASRFALYCRYNWYYQVHRAATRNRVWSKDYTWGEFDDTPFSLISGKVAGDASYDLKSPETKFDENIIKKAVEDMLKEEHGHFTTPIFLAMNGHDISVACPTDTRLISKAKELFDGEIEIEHTDLEHFWNEAIPQFDKDNMTVLKGERRSYLKKGKWTYLFPSTVSSRTYLKQQDFEAYNKLVYKAEPAAALSSVLLGNKRQDYLDRGWKYLLSNHTHDANGGCAPDCVCLDMEYRYRKVNDCADIVFDDTLADIAKNLSPELCSKDDVQLIAYNPLPFERDVIVHVIGDLPEKFKDGFSADGIQVQTVKSEKSSIFMDSIWEVPTIMNSVHIEAYIKVKSVPACGYKTVILCAENNESNNKLANGNVMENANLRVEINNNGTINVTDKQSGKVYENLNYLSSQGEIGNAWKHQEPENDKTFTSENTTAQIELIENGDLSATFKVTYSFLVPKDCIDTQSEKMVSIPVTVYYTLQKDSTSVNIKTELVNNAYDHWLRANFNTGINTEYSYSDSHYDIVCRDVKIPDSTGWVEKAYGMQPLRTFACVENETDGFAIIPMGLYEYEVFEDTRMALTLIRGCRIKQAVSEEKITVLDDKGILCLGERSFEYNINFYHCEKAELTNIAAEIYAPVEVAFSGRGKGELSAENSLLEVDNKNIHISAIKPSEDGKGIVIRLFNPTDDTQTVNFNFGFKVNNLYIADMNEDIKVKTDSKVVVAKKKIVTLYAEV